MFKNLTLPLFFALTVFLSKQSGAQTIVRSVVSSGGESAISGTILLTYNIGEPVAELKLNSSIGILSTGFIQADANFLYPVATNNIAKQLIIFPNPVVGGIAHLDFNNIPDGSYKVDIIDAIGRVLFTKTIVHAKNNKTNLDLNVGQYKVGTYYIRVRNSLTQVQAKMVKL